MIAKGDGKNGGNGRKKAKAPSGCNKVRQAAFLKALTSELGNVTAAASRLTETHSQMCALRNAHYYWLEHDPEYVQKHRRCAEIRLDYAEKKLFERINEGSDACLIFFLKCQGKRRGYIERTEVFTSESQNLVINRYDGNKPNGKAGSSDIPDARQSA